MLMPLEYPTEVYWSFSTCLQGKSVLYTAHVVLKALASSGHTYIYNNSINGDLIMIPSLNEYANDLVAI